ncbi:vanadium-dependent haloperoxidase [Ferruginibacter sp.]
MNLIKLRKGIIRISLPFFFLFTTTGSFAQQKEQVLHNLNTLLVNTVMEDLFSPPVASRIYVYPNIAFYECIRLDDPSLPDLAGKLNGLKPIPVAAKGVAVDNFIAASISFSYVAQALVGSEYKIENWRKSFIDSVMKGPDTVLVKNSIQQGHIVGDSIVAWTKRDNYLKSRGMMRYVIGHKPGDWQPTPLDYAQGLEPHWNTIRPLTLKTAAQFSPKEKLVFSMDKKSVFYKTMMDEYNIGKNLDSAQKATALYWDDNPNVSKNIGHLNFFIHKISPGGHWVLIAQQACQQKNIPLTKTAQVYAFTAIGIFDAFISCWDEKYRTNLIRPITIINRVVDRDWTPFIQTPPFPESTSGHSVVSNAASEILTSLLGDNFSFTDRIEIPFGQGTRNFNSFYEASLQSSTSRVYGGIHYPETARISVQHGRTIGKYIINLLYPQAAIK